MAVTEADIGAALALGPGAVRSDFDLDPARPPRPAAQTLRAAAVLCGLVPRRSGLMVVLTRRAAHLRSHAGQIAFPGGKIEPDDPTPEAAALREAQEEIGLGPAHVRVLGRLDGYQTVTGFSVVPVVGLVSPTWTACIDPGEVDQVFEAPLDFLMDPRNCHRHHHERDGQRRLYYAMPWEEHYIWGATAAMLKSLSDRLAAGRATAVTSGRGMAPESGTGSKSASGAGAAVAEALSGSPQAAPDGRA